MIGQIVGRAKSGPTERTHTQHTGTQAEKPHASTQASHIMRAGRQAYARQGGALDRAEIPLGTIPPLNSPSPPVCCQSYHENKKWNQVVVASPRPAAATIAAAHVSGADTLLCVGGAQAVAAMAFG